MIEQAPQKIAVFRALQLGDMLCAVPAIRALREARPEAEITLIGLPWAASFVQRFSQYFDRFIPFPGYPGLPEQEYDESAFRWFLEEMQAEAFDLLLQMQGNGTIVNELLSQFNAVNLAGFHNEESRMQSMLFMEYPAYLHETERHCALMRYLGIPVTSTKMEFPLLAGDHAALAQLGLPLKAGKYVCIHPGSRGGWRQWPPQYFALLADHCAEKGFDIVVTGTAAEKDITREVIKCLHHPAIDLTGLTSLGMLAALLHDSFLLVANCTGVSHMAAALRVPSLIISMDGEPYRWAPQNKVLHRTIDWTLQPGIGKVVLELNNFILYHTSLIADSILS
jgi:ADP-heptose:LPS heptosyltransferase